MDNDFASIIRKLRRERGWNQDDLAERSGISRTTVAKYETGLKKRPSAETIGKFAKALGVSASVLMGEEEAPDPSVVSDEDVKFALFGGDAARITDEQFEEVKRFAKYIAQREAGK